MRAEKCIIGCRVISLDQIHRKPKLCQQKLNSYFYLLSLLSVYTAVDVCSY